MLGLLVLVVALVRHGRVFPLSARCCATEASNEGRKGKAWAGSWTTGRALAWFSADRKHSNDAALLMSSLGWCGSECARIHANAGGDRRRIEEATSNTVSSGSNPSPSAIHFPPPKDTARMPSCTTTATTTMPLTKRQNGALTSLKRRQQPTALSKLLLLLALLLLPSLEVMYYPFQGVRPHRLTTGILNIASRPWISHAT